MRLNQRIGRILGTISIKLEDLFTGDLHDVGGVASGVLWDLYYLVFGRTLPEYKPVSRCKVTCGECDWEGDGESWYDHYERTGHGKFTWLVGGGK